MPDTPASSVNRIDVRDLSIVQHERVNWPRETVELILTRLHGLLHKLLLLTGELGHEFLLPLPGPPPPLLLLVPALAAGPLPPLLLVLAVLHPRPQPVARLHDVLPAHGIQLGDLAQQLANEEGPVADSGLRLLGSGAARRVHAAAGLGVRRRRGRLVGIVAVRHS